MFLAWFDSRIEEPSGADLGLGGGLDWVASHPPFEEAKKIEKDCLAEIKANTLDRYLIVTCSALSNCLCCPSHFVLLVR